MSKNVSYHTEKLQDELIKVLENPTCLLQIAIPNEVSYARTKLIHQLKLLELSHDLDMKEKIKNTIQPNFIVIEADSNIQNNQAPNENDSEGLYEEDDLDDDQMQEDLSGYSDQDSNTQ